MSTIYLRNTTGSPIEIGDLGLKIPALTAIRVDDQFLDSQIFESANNGDLRGNILTSNIKVNTEDGTTVLYDLSAGEAFRYLKPYSYDSATNNNVKDIQIDATLDPGASPARGDRYILTDTGNLHANFGTIIGVADNDIVEWDGDNLIWIILRPKEGLQVWNEDNDSYYLFRDSEWTALNAYMDHNSLFGLQGGNGLSEYYHLNAYAYGYAIAMDQYVNSSSTPTFDGLISTDDIDVSNNKVVNVANPTDPQDVATKAYVDSVAGGVDWQESVLDKDLTSPPGSPSAGDRYLIGLDTTAGTATGAWSGKDGQIAEWNGSSWDFTVPTEGTAVFVEDENRAYIFDGSTLWVTFSSIIDHNALSGLQGGTTAQYYHLTSSEHTEVTSWLDDVTLGSSGDLDLGSSGNLTTNSLFVKSNGFTINSDAAGSGSDWSITINRPTSGMTANYTLTLPIDDGVAGQFLRTDGSGNLSWVDPGTTVTLNEVSSASTTTGDSLYQMTSAVNVEFRSSAANPLIYLVESTERIGLGVNSGINAKLTIGNTGTNSAIQIPNSGSAPSSNLADGQIHMINGILYAYDNTRAKWLSVGENSLQFGRSGNSDGVYMQFGGDVDNSTSGARMLRNGTIVAVTALSSGGNATKSFDVEIAGAVAFSFSLSSNAYTSTTDNTNFSANDRINVFVSAAGTPVTNPVVILWIKWRE